MKQQNNQEEQIVHRIIIQPTQFKFMIFMDSTLQVQVDKLYQKQTRKYIDQRNIEQIENLKYEVRQLKPILLEHQQHQEILDQLNVQIKNQMNAILSKDQIIKNIENTYIEQIQDIKIQYEQQYKDIINECENLKKSNQELEQTNKKYLIQNDALLKANVNLNEKINELEGKLFLYEKNLIQSNQELEQLKDIRNGALIIKGAYKLLNKMYEDNNIYTLLCNKHKGNVLKCLEPKDLFSLMLTNKQMYFIIQNNRQLISYIVQQRTNVLQREINYLQTEYNFFKDMVNQVPEESLKIGICKFFVFKFNIGQYMNEIFNDSFDLVEGKMQSNQQNEQKNNNQQQQQQQQQQNIQENLYQNEDLLGLGETDEQQQQQKSQIQNNNNQINQNQQHTIQQTASNFISKIKSYTQTSKSAQNIQNKQNSPINKNKSLSDLSIQLQQEYQEIDNLIVEAVQIPFLKEQVVQTRRDMAEIMKRANQINNQLFQQGLKCIPSINYQPKFTIQDYMFTLQKTFSKLIANSHYLQLESLQLQQLCNYFGQLLIKQHKTIYQLKSKIDDQCEEIQSLKEMKYYVQNRVTIFEERIIKCEEQIFNLNKMNYDQRQQITIHQKKEQQYESEFNEKEHKIHTLMKAVKQIKIEKDTIENKLNQILNNFKNVKSALSKCN